MYFKSFGEINTYPNKEKQTTLALVITVFPSIVFAWENNAKTCKKGARSIRCENTAWKHESR